MDDISFEIAAVQPSLKTNINIASLTRSSSSLSLAKAMADTNSQHFLSVLYVYRISSFFIASRSVSHTTSVKGRLMLHQCMSE